MKNATRSISKDVDRGSNTSGTDVLFKYVMVDKPANVLCKKIESNPATVWDKMQLVYLIENASQRRGLNMKSGNILILCCDNIPLAKIKILHVLHRNIIRPVFVGFNVAIDLQKRQCTIRSHESITDN
jgi:hypothetical protein